MLHVYGFNLGPERSECQQTIQMLPQAVLAEPTTSFAIARDERAILLSPAASC